MNFKWEIMSHFLGLIKSLWKSATGFLLEYTNTERGARVGSEIWSPDWVSLCTLCLSAEWPAIIRKKKQHDGSREQCIGPVFSRSSALLEPVLLSKAIQSQKSRQPFFSLFCWDRVMVAKLNTLPYVDCSATDTAFTLCVTTVVDEVCSRITHLFLV